MKVTMKDIANRLGISINAVSIALNDKTGVSDENIKEFLEFDKIFACGGSWMVKGTPEEIKEKCLKTRKIIKGEN